MIREEDVKEVEAVMKTDHARGLVIKLVHLKNVGGKRMSRIDPLLAKEQIQVIDTVENWKTAVEIASEPLLKSEMIAHTYLDNMIKSVEEHGPYMVFNRLFCPHARQTRRRSE